jgi:VCBS repeat-containing protein
MSNVPAEGVSPATLPVPPDGVVTGSFDIRDPSGLPIDYVISHGPALGVVVMLADGSWTYTPTQAARLSAALAATGTETRDTFSVEASDADAQVGGGGEILTVAPATLTLTHQIPVPTTGEPFGAALSSDAKRIFLLQGNSEVSSRRRRVVWLVALLVTGCTATTSGTANRPDGNAVDVAHRMRDKINRLG